MVISVYFRFFFWWLLMDYQPGNPEKWFFFQSCQEISMFNERDKSFFLVRIFFYSQVRVWWLLNLEYAGI